MPWRLHPGGCALTPEVMSILAEDSPVMQQTKSLCEAITQHNDFDALMGTVKTFLDNDEARTSYQNVHQLGGELQQKQQAGIELSDTEIKQFEDQREQLFNNPVAKNFMDAKAELEGIQRTVSQYVGMTLELGRVPTAEDFAATQGGCCGGGESGGGG